MNCVCDSGLPQMYRADCKSYIKKVEDILPMQRVANDGTSNFIDLTTIPVAESVFMALFQNSYSSKRLHILRGVKNFTQEAADAKVQTWDDDTTTKLSDGPLSITFTIPETDPLFISLSEALECGNPGVFFRTVTNQLVGYNGGDVATDKKLYPIPVDSWTVKPSPFTTSTTVALVEVTVKFAITMDYGKWVVVNSDEHLLDGSKNYEARQGILAQGLAAPTTTSLQVKVMTNSSGILGNTVPVSGLNEAPTTTEIVLFNETTSTAITVLTSTETPAGSYALTFAAQTSSDVIKVTLAAATGYVADSITITIP